MYVYENNMKTRCAENSDIVNMSGTSLYFHRRVGTICLHVHMGRCVFHVDGENRITPIAF